MTYVKTSLLAAALATGSAMGQSINIDFGLPGNGPSDSYAAAGLAGKWNSVEGEHTSIGNPTAIYDLVDLDGNATGVTLHQFGGQDMITAGNDPSVEGDDAILMNDCIVTHSAGLETCLFINGLESGTYEIITYAWMPNSPETDNRVRLDFDPVTFDIGGAWTGEHVEGITYSVHTQEITNGFIGLHSGNVPGADLSIGAAMNGVQLHLLADCGTLELVDGGTGGQSFSERAFDGYIDPRAESTNGSDFDLGLNEITIAFSTPAKDAGGDTLTAASFDIAHTAGIAPPTITGILTEDAMNVTLHLDRPLMVGAWTTISTTAVSECGDAPIVGRDQVTVGFLPGDVDQNGLVSPFDLLRFRQIVNGAFTAEVGVNADYADIDRSGAIAPFDLLRFRQTVNGISPATQTWAGATLP